MTGRVVRKQRYRTRPNNFMSMSDDEDDLDDITSLSQIPRSPPTPATRLQSALLEVLQEQEDVVVPSPSFAPGKQLSTPSSKKSRGRQGTLESLLSPLTNFIDLRDDDGSTLSWRSFVEIS